MIVSYYDSIYGFTATEMILLNLLIEIVAKFIKICRNLEMDEFGDEIPDNLGLPFDFHRGNYICFLFCMCNNRDNCVYILVNLESIKPFFYLVGPRKRKRDREGEDRNNLCDSVPRLNPEDKVDLVNQLVLSHAHSHRLESSSIRNDIFSIMPQPQTVIHNIWPSTRVTGKDGNIVRIKPIMPQHKRDFKRIPLRYRVPLAGEDRIPDDVWEHIDEFWFPLSAGVTLQDYLDYSYYKHSRYHFLNLVNEIVWSMTIERSYPFI